MKSRKRALRRHHRRRMIRHALRSYLLCGWDDPRERLEVAVRTCDYLKRCSCYMCGNPRRFGGSVPVQEQRLREAARQELIEAFAAGENEEPRVRPSPEYYANEHGEPAARRDTGHRG